MVGCSTEHPEVALGRRNQAKLSKEVSSPGVVLYLCPSLTAVVTSGTGLFLSCPL